MRAFTLPVLVMCAAATPAAAVSEAYLAANARAMWAGFKAAYARAYATPEEEAYRYLVFVENMKRAAQLQAAAQARGQSSEPAAGDRATFGVNKFADMTPEEFAATRLTRGIVSARHAGAGGEGTPQARMHPHPHVHPGPPPPADLPETVDWRVSGAVVHIKDQGACGSGWSFATVGGIEGQNALHGTKKLEALSEQQLISCDKYEAGCTGGDLQTPFEWLLEKNNGVVATEASYPYVSTNGTVPGCANLTGKAVGAVITGFRAVYPSPPPLLRAFLANNGPASAAMEGSLLHHYTGGVLAEGCCDDEQSACKLTHGVVLVGYGTASKTDYWILKNSYGADWGEGGYLRVRAGSCGLTWRPIAPLF